MRTAARVAVTVTAAAVLAGSAGIAGPALAHAATVPAARPAPVPDCTKLLAAYRHVSRMAGLVIGSDGLPWNEPSWAAAWARVLRRAGDPALARTAAAVNDPRSGDAFVMAFTAAADAAMTAEQWGGSARVCSVPGDVASVTPARALPGWVHWRPGPGVSVIVWGGTGTTRGKVGGGSCIVRRNGTAGPS
jgi:hypothetical protein